jgi:hypothetical protein
VSVTLYLRVTYPVSPPYIIVIIYTSEREREREREIERESLSSALFLSVCLSQVEVEVEVEVIQYVNQIVEKEVEEYVDVPVGRVVYNDKVVVEEVMNHDSLSAHTKTNPSHRATPEMRLSSLIISLSRALSLSNTEL